MPSFGALSLRPLVEQADCAKPQFRLSATLNVGAQGLGSGRLRRRSPPFAKASFRRLRQKRGWLTFHCRLQAEPLFATESHAAVAPPKGSDTGGIPAVLVAPNCEFSSHPIWNSQYWKRGNW